MDDPLDAAKAVLLRFTPEERRELHRFLAVRLGRKPKPTRHVARVESRDGKSAVIYREERVKCGDKSCRCATRGELHGPYWYRYWRTDDGKLRKQYVGKKRPPGAGAAPAASAASGDAVTRPS